MGSISEKRKEVAIFLKIVAVWLYIYVILAVVNDSLFE